MWKTAHTHACIHGVFLRVWCPSFPNGQAREALEGQDVLIGAWEAFDGGEACTTRAGDAAGVRKAVDAVAGSGDSVVVVLGECADYRHVRF